MGLMQKNDPRLLRAQQEHAQKMFDNSLSRNTRLNYRIRVYKFQEMGYGLPASPGDIVAFLNIMSRTLSPRTLMAYVHALRCWHKLNDFIDPTTDVRVFRMMEGIKKTYGKPPKKAKPFSIEDMTKISKFYEGLGGFNSLRNNALLLVGFFGALRRSELVAIRVDHLTFSEKGMTILLPRSKTDQAGEGQTIWLPYMNELCPVKALQEWLTQSGIIEGYIWPSTQFGRILRAGKHITTDAIYAIIKDIADIAGLEEPHLYSGHSLRRGFATEAAKRGITVGALMKHGRWQNVQVAQGYIEEANNFEENALNVFNNP